MRLARPCAWARIRLMSGPASTVMVFTFRFLAFAPLASPLTPKLATADFSTFSTMRALFFFAPSPNRMDRASSTGLPRTMSATCRMRLVEERMYLPLAIASMLIPLLLRRGRRAGRLGLFGLDVAAEGAGEREFAQLVADHVFGYEHGDKSLPVVHRDGLSHE